MIQFEIDVFLSALLIFFFRLKYFKMQLRRFEFISCFYEIKSIKGKIKVNVNLWVSLFQSSSTLSTVK